MVGLDLLGVIQVIDHDAIRLLDPARRHVAQPVHPLQPRAVAEVEARHRVGPPALAGVNEVGGTQPGQRRLQRLRKRRILPPTLPAQQGAEQGRGIVLRAVLPRRGAQRRNLVLPQHVRASQLLAQPAAEARHRRQRGEAHQPRQLGLQFRHHLLDQEVAERHPPQPVLAVGDRVEDRRVRPGLTRPLGPFVAVAGEQGLHGGRQTLGQRHLDKDKRIARQRRMEEGEAPPIRRQPPPQVGPAGDLVHRLVGDQLLQHRRGRLPVDAPQLQEAAVEPRPQQVAQVGVERLQRRLGAQVVQQLPAHGDQRRGAARRHVDAAQQFLPGRVGGLGELRRVLRGSVGQIGLGGPAQPVLLGQEVLREVTVEGQPVRGAKLLQRQGQLPRHRRPGRLAALGQQGRRQLLRALQRRRRGVGLQHVGIGPPTVGDGGPKPLQQRAGRHRGGGGGRRGRGHRRHRAVPSVSMAVSMAVRVAVSVATGAAVSLAAGAAPQPARGARHGVSPRNGTAKDANQLPARL